MNAPTIKQKRSGDNILQTVFPTSIFNFPFSTFNFKKSQMQNQLCNAEIDKQ